MPHEAATIERGIESRTGRPGLLLRTPFHVRHEEFRETLKQLPRNDRYWDDGRTAWWIAEEHEEGVRRLCLRYWSQVMTLGQDGEGDVLTDRTGSARQERLAL